MSKNRGLGRGFDSLIPTEVTADMPASVQPPSENMIQLVDPSKIVPNPHQPRRDFDQDELQGLANSIKEYGILHPPVVTDTGHGVYQLIAGERRVRASKLAGLDTIPVIVRSYDEQQKLELALLENVQRSELNPVETAVAYRKLADEFNLSLDEIGQRMGKARSTVANVMRLLQLPPAALDAVAHGKIAEAHGRAILAVEGTERQLELLNHILNDSWSVRQAEEFARNVKTAPNRSESTPVKTAANDPRAGELSKYLHTKVKLQSTAKGGRIVIEYKSDEELQRIADMIRPQR